MLIIMYLHKKNGFFNGMNTVKKPYLMGVF